MGCFLCCFPVCRSLYCQLLCSCLCPKLVFQFAFFLCGAFPHKGFVIQFIVGILVGFELPVPQAGVSVRVLLVRSFSPQGFLLFSSLLVFLLVLSFSLSIHAFPHMVFCWVVVSVARLVCAFPTGVFAVSLCQFSVVDLLSPCLDSRPVGFCSRSSNQTSAHQLRSACPCLLIQQKN